MPSGSGTSLEKELVTVARAQAVQQKAEAREPTPPPATTVAVVQERVAALLGAVGRVIVGKQKVLESVALGILSEGSHVLFEDVPGLAKSVMAAAFSRASGCLFKRVQFTPDLLPSDITGNNVYDQATQRFVFHPGPIFSNFLLADEINRASPKTQSALLEAMAEKQVSVEGTTRRLDKPFIVLATQNPVEQEGTYQLPEAQLDRFAMKLSMGYSDHAEEMEILQRRMDRGKDDFDVTPVTSPAEVVAMQKATETVKVHRELVGYICSLVVATRDHPLVLVGSSPRGSLALLKLGRANAALNGRSYIRPDDIKRIAVPTLAHRLILRPEARIKSVPARKIVEEILANVPVPKV